MLVIDYGMSSRIQTAMRNPRYYGISYVDVTLALQDLLWPGRVNTHVPDYAYEIAELCYRDDSIVAATWRVCPPPFTRNDITYYPTDVVRIG